jgi:hypothetical protein
MTSRGARHELLRVVLGRVSPGAAWRAYAGTSSAGSGNVGSRRGPRRMIVTARLPAGARTEERLSAVGDRLRGAGRWANLDRQGSCQPALSFFGEAEVRDADVGRGLFALDQTRLLGAPDEVGNGRLREPQARSELRDGRAFASVGGSFDHQDEQVALRCQPARLCDQLALAQ